MSSYVQYIPIGVALLSAVVALLGAGLAAYFAIIKSKKERLWVERYELTNELVCDLDTIQNKYEIEHMESMGLNVVSPAESQSIYEASSELLPKVWKNTSRLQILFKKKHINAILLAGTELNSSFQDLRNMSPDEYVADYQHSVADKAQIMLNEVINLAQKKCL